MWFYVALGAAFLSGFSTIISKHTLKRISPLVFFWAVLIVSIPVIWISAWKEGIPSFSYAFFIGIAGSVVFYSISKILFYKSIKDSELSRVHPLSSLGSIFTLVFSAIILRDNPSVIGLIGVSITILGTYVLNISSMSEGLLEPFSILFRNKLSFLMLASVIAGSVVIVFDKLAVNHTFPQNTSFVLLVEDLVIVFGLIPWIFKKRKIVLPEIKGSWGSILLLGILGAVDNIFAFIAIGKGNPGLVTTILRTQVFFVLLFSFLFLGDRPKTETVVGTIIMIAGLVVLKLGS